MKKYKKMSTKALRSILYKSMTYGRCAAGDPELALKELTRRGKA